MAGTTPAWRSPQVLAIGIVSLLTDTASEMVIPLLPVFLTTTLGAGAMALGAIEGIANGVASVLKLWSGRIADRTGRTRPLMLTGYGLSNAVRPLIAIALLPWHVLALRVTDRVGKGLRSAPRDALLAASVPASQRGAAFGLHRGMDHTGAVLGPLLAVAMLTWWTTDLRTIFAVSVIPGILAVLTIVFFVRESADARPSTTVPSLRGHGRLWRFLLPLVVFTLGNASDTFLLLAAGTTRTDIRVLPLLWVGLHVVRAVSAVPGGRLADRIGPRAAIALGWAWFALVYIGLAFARDPWTIAALVLAFGLYNGLVEGPQAALVADLSTPERRGEAFGLYHLCVGLAAIPASLGFGFVWETLGRPVAFLGAAGLAGVALFLLLWRVAPGIPQPEAR